MDSNSSYLNKNYFDNQMDDDIKQFIILAGGDPTRINSSIFYFELLHPFKTIRSWENEHALTSFVITKPKLLTAKIKDHTIFEYFFDRTLSIHPGSIMYSYWQTIIISIMKLLQLSENCEDILDDHRYVYRLQSTIMNHNELFKFMITEGNFSIGDPEYLVYSIIVRGELEKLQVLSSIFDLDDKNMFPAMFDIALTYGRFNIIAYLCHELHIDITEYGKVLEFCNYKPSHKYMFYQNGMYTIDQSESPIIGSYQNYIKSIRCIMEYYKYPVTVNTLNSWAELARKKIYSWDILTFKDVVETLRPYIKESIPLSYDFKEFNIDVFGREWSDRACIIEYCKKMEEQYALLELKYNALLKTSEPEDLGPYE